MRNLTDTDEKGKKYDNSTVGGVIILRGKIVVFKADDGL